MISWFRGPKSEIMDINRYIEKLLDNFYFSVVQNNKRTLSLYISK